MAEGEYRRDRSAIFPGQPDFNFVAHAVNQVPEPDPGLGKQVMASSRHER